MQPSPKRKCRPHWIAPREPRGHQRPLPTAWQEGMSEWVREDMKAQALQQALRLASPARPLLSDLCWVCSPSWHPASFPLLPALHPPPPGQTLFPQDKQVGPGSPGTARGGGRLAAPRPSWFLWGGSGGLRPLRNTARSVHRRSPLLGPQFVQSPRRAPRQS